VRATLMEKLRDWVCMEHALRSLWCIRVRRTIARLGEDARVTAPFVKPRVIATTPRRSVSQGESTPSLGTLRKAATFFGAQDSPSLQQHERDRALQRAILCLIVLCVWGVETLREGVDQPLARIGVPIMFGHLLATACNRRSLGESLGFSLLLLYSFLALDPIVVVVLSFSIQPHSRSCIRCSWWS